MILTFKNLDGENVDIVADTIQLIDKGEKAETYDTGMEARYHLMVGDGGWCHRLSKKEYDRLHGIFARLGVPGLPTE